MRNIVEIIPDDIPYYALEAMERGQLYIVLLDRVKASDKVITAAIDFIDQMRVQGNATMMLPAEYDNLVDAVKPYRTEK